MNLWSMNNEASINALILASLYDTIKVYRICENIEKCTTLLADVQKVNKIVYQFINSFKHFEFLYVIVTIAFQFS